MDRRVKWRAIARRVTESATERNAIAKQVRHLPRRHAAKKPSTTRRLADLETVRFVDPEIPASLQVQTRRAERLDARAVDEHLPAIESLRRGYQGEGGVPQLRCAALRMRDKN